MCQMCAGYFWLMYSHLPLLSLAALALWTKGELWPFLTHIPVDRGYWVLSNLDQQGYELKMAKVLL